MTQALTAEIERVRAVMEIARERRRAEPLGSEERDQLSSDLLYMEGKVGGLSFALGCAKASAERSPEEIKEALCGMIDLITAEDVRHHIDVFVNMCGERLTEANIELLIGHLHGNLAMIVQARVGKRLEALLEAARAVTIRRDDSGELWFHARALSGKFGSVNLGTPGPIVLSAIDNWYAQLQDAITACEEGAPDA